MAVLRRIWASDENASNLAPRRVRFFIAGACLWMCAALITTTMRSARAQSSPSEYEVKAAFLFNFAKFVEWPEDAFSDSSSPIIICIVGHDPFNGVLDQTIGGKTVNSRPLVIKRLAYGQDARGCHIIFVCSSEKKRMAQILASFSGTSALTVSDMDDFAQAGGMINFVLENSKVRFQINSTAAARARLRISSKLLTLARKVIQ
ncbi:MAG TPA: YfiR family protein [Blastocatellia bacterium]